MTQLRVELSRFRERLGEISREMEPEDVVLGTAEG